VIEIPPTQKKSGPLGNFPNPKTVFEVRSFLGLASYNRCFIKDFAAIASPISDISKGENGSVSRHRSRHIQVHFNEAPTNSFSSAYVRFYFMFPFDSSATFDDTACVFNYCLFVFGQLLPKHAAFA